MTALTVEQEFEAWLRSACFQKPTPEAYDLAKSAWSAAPPCPDAGLADELQKWVDADESGGRKLVDSFLLDRIMAALRQSNAGKDSISEFEQIVKDESAQWKGVGDDTHGAQTACQMILQKIAALKERT